MRLAAIAKKCGLKVPEAEVLKDDPSKKKGSGKGKTVLQRSTGLNVTDYTDELAQFMGM